ncbi:MAG TPA: inositol monophosphatase, partial [Pseudomonas sp.]|nr:inositol monophosphatase [Pseudomonas sp.]
MTAIAPAIAERYRAVQDIAREAAQLGLDFYRRRAALQVDHKGSDLQDVVSIADKTLEDLIRQRLSERFPEDGLLGEEGGAT